MATTRINSNAHREVKLEKNSATTFAEVTFDCMSLNARSRRAFISSWVRRVEPRWEAVGYARTRAHRGRKRVDCFRRTGRRLIPYRPFLHVSCTYIGALRLKGGKLYHARAHIEGQASPAVAGFNNYNPSTKVCRAYLENDPTVRTGRDPGFDSSCLSARASGAKPLALSDSISQSLSDPSSTPERSFS